MRDLTPWRYKLTSIQYYFDIVKRIFIRKKNRKNLKYLEVSRKEKHYWILQQTK